MLPEKNRAISEGNKTKQLRGTHLLNHMSVVNLKTITRFTHIRTFDTSLRRMQVPNQQIFGVLNRPLARYSR